MVLVAELDFVMKAFLFLVIIALISVMIVRDKPNSKPTYGDTGLPKNCRAIIKTIVDEYQQINAENTEFFIKNADEKHYDDLWEKVEFYESQLKKIDGEFQSLDRNCGEFGYSWDYN